MFGVPFEEIASIVGRTPDAARQLASRARRRVQGKAPEPEADLTRQREGTFEGLLAVLDPDVVLRVDYGSLPVKAPREVRGARNVAGGAVIYQRQERVVRHAFVNGAAGLISFENGRPVSVVGFTIVGGRIVAMDILSDPERLARLDLAPLLGTWPPGDGGGARGRVEGRPCFSDSSPEPSAP